MIAPESESLMSGGQRSHDACALNSLQTLGKSLEPSDPLPPG